MLSVLKVEHAPQRQDPPPEPHFDPEQLANQVGFTVELQVNPFTRTIYLFNEIDEGSVKKFVPAFESMDATKGPINIILASPGGSITDGLVIYSTIAKAQNKVAIYGVGQVFSMAAIIMQAADVRVMDRYCRMLIHSGSSMFEGETQNHFAHVEAVRGLLVDLKAIVHQRSGLTPAEVEEMFGKETFLSPQEALALNLIDSIGDVPVKESESVSRPARKRGSTRKKASNK
jgi:ATP-dependent protease ClpP protease subunit